MLTINAVNCHEFDLLFKNEEARQFRLRVVIGIANILIQHQFPRNTIPAMSEPVLYQRHDPTFPQHGHVVGDESDSRDFYGAAMEAVEQARIELVSSLPPSDPSFLNECFAAMTEAIGEHYAAGIIQGTNR